MNTTQSPQSQRRFPARRDSLHRSIPRSAARLAAVYRRRRYSTPARSIHRKARASSCEAEGGFFTDGHSKSESCGDTGPTNSATVNQ